MDVTTHPIVVPVVGAAAGVQDLLGTAQKAANMDVTIQFSYRAHDQKPYQNFMAWCVKHCAGAFECIAGSFVLPDAGKMTYRFERDSDATAFEKRWGVPCR